MALVTVSDYQLFLNEVLYYMDQNFSGIDKNGLWIYGHILPEDFKTVMTAYYTYKQTRQGQAGTGVSHIVNNATPSANKTTFATGGASVESPSPTTW